MVILENSGFRSDLLLPKISAKERAGDLCGNYNFHANFWQYLHSWQKLKMKRKFYFLENRIKKLEVNLLHTLKNWSKEMKGNSIVHFKKLYFDIFLMTNITIFILIFSKIWLLIFLSIGREHKNNDYKLNIWRG